MIRMACIAILVSAACLLAPVALAQTAQSAPESEDGRYTFNRAGDNYLRLDTRTGQVSLCSRRAVGWACSLVPDERSVLEGEIARLQTENGTLKKELLARNLPLPDGVRSDPAPGKPDELRLRLPNDEDINTVVSFISRMWRRLVEAMVGLQNDVLRKSYAVAGRGGLSGISVVAPQAIATATLMVETPGAGFTDITADARRFVKDAAAKDGALFLYLRHTSASLTIQENADPDVLTDLTTALRRLAPEDAGWVHATEGSDDMPAHVKAMLTGVSLHVPVVDGAIALGTWQGIYLVEHRARPHRREVVLQFVGCRS